MIELKDNFNLKKIHCYTSNSLFSYRVVGNLTQKLKKKDTLSLSNNTYSVSMAHFNK